jgi:hypothetical protein
MVFLIEYNRSEGVLVTFRTFEDAQRQQARDLCFQLELDLNRRGVAHEVVLLEADSEAAIRRTHGRYFYGLRELLKTIGRAE